jgi:hypothetical protein
MIMLFGTQSPLSLTATVKRWRVVFLFEVL